MIKKLSCIHRRACHIEIFDLSAWSFHLLQCIYITGGQYENLKSIVIGWGQNETNIHDSIPKLQVIMICNSFKCSWLGSHKDISWRSRAPQSPTSCKADRKWLFVLKKIYFKTYLYLKRMIIYNFYKKWQFSTNESYNRLG